MFAGRYWWILTDNLLKWGMKDGDDVTEEDITDEWLTDLIRGN